MSLTNQEAESILSPSVQKYVDAINNADYKAVENFYHPNSVMIEKNKSCIYGKEPITDSLRELVTVGGKTVMKISNSSYEGVGDFINIHTDFVFETEKVGNITGRYLQIWKKENNEYTIYHDEYEIL